jgi:hypothetical protein
MHNKKALLAATAGMILAGLLAACGGGGGSTGATKPVTGASNTGGSTATAKTLQVAISNIADGAQGVPVNVEFRLDFSADLTAGVRADQVELSDGTTITPLMVYNAGPTLSLALAFPLRAGTDYTLTVKPGLSAKDGSVLNSAYVLRFKTAVAEYEFLKLAPEDNSAQGSNMPRIVSADVNGDGRPDLVELANLYRHDLLGANGYRLKVYLQNAGKGFDKVQTLEFITDQSGYTNNFNNLFALDVDGDGKPELLVPEFGVSDAAHNGIRVFKTGADGQFAAQDFIATNYTATLEAFDVDGDGRLDLVGSNRRALDQVTGGFQVLLRTATGFSALAPVTLPDSNYEFGVADLDQDGKRELIVNRVFAMPNSGPTKNELLVYSQSQPGEFSLNAGLSAETAGFCAKADYCSGMKIVDWNNDGKPVLVFEASTPYAPDVHAWLYAFSRKAEGGLASVFETPLGAHVYGFRDMNGDGIADIVLTGTEDNHGAYFTVVHGKRDFSLEPYKIVYLPFPTVIYPWNIAIGDMDGDGRPDLVFDIYNSGIVMARRTAF